MTESDCFTPLSVLIIDIDTAGTMQRRGHLGALYRCDALNRNNKAATSGFPNASWATHSLAGERRSTTRNGENGQGI